MLVRRVVGSRASCPEDNSPTAIRDPKSKPEDSRNGGIAVEVVKERPPSVLYMESPIWPTQAARPSNHTTTTTDESALSLSADTSRSGRHSAGGVLLPDRSHDENFLRDQNDRQACTPRHRTPFWRDSQWPSFHLLFQDLGDSDDHSEWHPLRALRRHPPMDVFSRPEVSDRPCHAFQLSGNISFESMH